LAGFVSKDEEEQRARRLSQPRLDGQASETCQHLHYTRTQIHIDILTILRLNRAQDVYVYP
jgi:hypothetical protein